MPDPKAIRDEQNRLNSRRSFQSHPMLLSEPKRFHDLLHLMHRDYPATLNQILQVLERTEDPARCEALIKQADKIIAKMTKEVQWHSANQCNDMFLSVDDDDALGASATASFYQTAVSSVAAKKRTTFRLAAKKREAERRAAKKRNADRLIAEGKLPPPAVPEKHVEYYTEEQKIQWDFYIFHGLWDPDPRGLQARYRDPLDYPAAWEGKVQVEKKM